MNHAYHFPNIDEESYKIAFSVVRYSICLPLNLTVKMTNNPNIINNFFSGYNGDIYIYAKSELIFDYLSASFDKYSSYDIYFSYLTI